MRQLILIAAAGENNALGLDNDLPWHLPNDFKRFKQLTTGHKIIMGRKTFESFPKPLPNREHIVITRDKAYRPKFECVLKHSLQDAIDHTTGDAIVYIIGGGQIYRQAMEIATKIELTRVHARPAADTFFPDIPEDQWELTSETYHPKDEKHAYAFSYLTYKKKV